MNYEKRLREYLLSVKLADNKFIKYIKTLKNKIINITK